MRGLQARLPSLDSESGLTLIEMLVAAAMSVVIVGAAASMLISAVQTQPELSKRSQNISTARYVLERMTRELRSGFYIYPSSTSSSISFKTRLRRTTCGGDVPSAATTPAIACRVTYTCTTTTTTTACTRSEGSLESSGGTAATLIGNLQSREVFSYSPSVEEPTYVGITLKIANPEGDGNLTISDGANLRTLSLVE